MAKSQWYVFGKYPAVEFAVCKDIYLDTHRLSFYWSDLVVRVILKPSTGMGTMPGKLFSLLEDWACCMDEKSPELENSIGDLDDIASTIGIRRNLEPRGGWPIPKYVWNFEPPLSELELHMISTDDREDMNEKEFAELVMRLQGTTAYRLFSLLASINEKSPELENLISKMTGHIKRAYPEGKKREFKP